METPINNLLQENENPGAGFAQMETNDQGQGQQQGHQEQLQSQDQVPQDFRPLQNLPIGTDSQGNSVTMGPGSLLKREMFSVERDDILSVLLVFFIVLLVASGIINSQLKTVPTLADANGKLTLIGIVLIAILASIIYICVKLGSKAVM